MDFKKLHTKKRLLNESLQDIREDKYIINKKETQILKELEHLNKRLSKYRNGELVITEHAMIRYMQRVKHLDTKALKKLIVPEVTQKLIEKFGSGKFPAGSHYVVVKNKIVMTVLFSDSGAPDEI